MKHYQGELIFVTDPICSWCWAMLPEMLKLREHLGERLNFALRFAGLQVGGQEPLSDANANQLIELWQHVADTTGQQFAFSLPADTTFIYHSELACRTLHIARQISGEEPWAILNRMQQAFYVECTNLSDLDRLFELIADTNLSRDEFEGLIRSEAIAESTHSEFEWCKQRETHAIPTLFLDTGDGPKLISGGYVTAEYLLVDLNERITAH